MIVMVVMMLMMHDKRVNVLNFLSFFGDTPGSLALRGSFVPTISYKYRTTLPPIFFLNDGMALLSLVVSVLACPVIIVEYSLSADSFTPRGPLSLTVSALN